MDFSFFTTNNKSGYKTRETWVNKNHPELHKSITDHCDNLPLELPFKEKLWFYFHKLTERPKCVSCGGDIKFRNRLDKPYGEFCSLSCINNDKGEMAKRQKKTFQKKYGVDFYPEHKGFIDKQKKTKLERYGDEKYNNVEKGKETKKKRYGNENYNNQDQNKKTCLHRYGVDNYSKSNNYQNQLTKEFKEKYPEVNITEVDKYFVKMSCDKCGVDTEITKQLIYERYKRDYDVCIKCNPIGQMSRSGIEKEVCKFLRELGVGYKTNPSVGGKEVDILLTKYNIGIEVDGLYWHNELFKSQNYHLDKTVVCEENGVELLHLFEDEWIHKKEIFKSILRYRVGKVENKIYARKCVVREVISKKGKEFMVDNHIQGSVNSSVRLGLYHKDELVSLMTFSKGRVIMGGKKDEYELNRFCNKINTNVIGAASKLLKHFEKTYSPERIISYSDIRLFGGGMYESLGFSRDGQSKPNYWYIMGTHRYHRFNFRKGKLITEGFDKSKTEKQIMMDRKIYRIYDCGNVRWVKKNTIS
jgi:hypothetical protein